MIADATCSGCASASSCTMAEPSDQPMACARRMSSASRRAEASSARPATVIGPSPRSLPPRPRLSKVITWYRSASLGVISPQSRSDPDVPMISSSGSPSPLIS
jgi:hypothetical protein